MDANLAALLTVVVTSLTTIIIAVLNMKKSSAIEKKVDAGNAVTDSVHTIANGRTDTLMRQLADANREIQRLSTLLPPPTGASATVPGSKP
ncbi:MAG: hypothetical protein JWL97_2981 [Gemmatimonadales bacterium]|nr:hypothetical protein [Gemmatimonadales bacterium]